MGGGTGTGDSIDEMKRRTESCERFGDLDRYKRVLRIGKTPEGDYGLHEVDNSGKGDRIIYFNSEGFIKKEEILI